MTRPSVSGEELLALRKDYLRSLVGSLGALRSHAEALRDRERFAVSYPLVLYMAHQIRGTSGSLGFARISELAAELIEPLETLLGEGSEPSAPARVAEDLGPVLDELERELDHAGRELEAVAPPF